MTRYGDHNARNRELVAETDRMGGNKWRKGYLEAVIRRNEKGMTNYLDDEQSD